MRKLQTAWKALTELGAAQLTWYAWYQLKLKSGVVRWQTQPKRHPAEDTLMPATRLFQLPDKPTLDQILDREAQRQLHLEADEILAGKARLFGGSSAPLNFAAATAQKHWTQYLHPASEDIKFTWEPARLGWACTLARAYFTTQDERYARGFWETLEAFLEAAPPYLGPHWLSAQEAAIRIIVLGFTWQIFQTSPHSTPQRVRRLVQVVADHARRIPPTLAYARAQNNNHLLVEAAGLWTAGLFLHSHPSAPQWRRTGWRWLHWALQNQIETDGSYIQHSTNYHRLMLQTALWCLRLAAERGERFPPLTLQRLAAASQWLGAMTDFVSGSAPNLGPNDGAYILPLSVLPFSDYRPIIQAAMRAFTGKPLLEAGAWDEMSCWLAPPARAEHNFADESAPASASPTVDCGQPAVILRSKTHRSWAYFRVARFRSRPGHADQLHLDLWWQGINLAQDAGTYLYNAPPPWENALAHTAVHNTAMINGQEQMMRQSRFLYLNWAQATLLSQESASDGSWARATAQHDGYREMGILHQRTVEVNLETWRVEDIAIPMHRHKPAVKAAMRLHWLLPDAAWELENKPNQIALRLFLSQGTISLSMSAQTADQQSGGSPPSLSIFRAGKRLTGLEPAQPTWGWIAPTYGVKTPALSIACQVEGTLPITMISEWKLPAP